MLSSAVKLVRRELSRTYSAQTIIIVCILITTAYNLGRILPADSVKNDPIFSTDSVKNDPSTNIRRTPLPRQHQDVGGVYTIPDDTTLHGLTNTMLTSIYWKYVNTLQVLCRNQTRLGNMRDGGKEVCLDKSHRPRTPCLVYSFGVVDGKKKAPGFVNFHGIGLGGRDITYLGGFVNRRLETIMETLNHQHRTIDILKIDVEGWEWRALPDIFKSGVLTKVRQLCLEVHFGLVNNIPRNISNDEIINKNAEVNDKANRKPAGTEVDTGRKPPTQHSENWGHVSMVTQLTVLRGLYEQGFRIFMREHNTYALQNFKRPYRTISNINELSFLNLQEKYGKFDW